ncbi:metal-dependent hydrolase [Rhodoferax sp. 4810]|uniref:Metal-dependent hydrolase n=1 Tax=Thiospirillum jenense TaxID=1653858 RepID=A0A839H8G9_9GAMM|nr:metal-dependent hydrolase [Thiospirillum jenense]MBB1073361.1 metal-dependent hydrolase [Rhodoferax jenense]MBB1125713.1 metal-dependent hydrolase [Thiospirillum jenense]
MANFKTHLSVGITVSSLTALAGYDRGLGDADQMQWLFLIGTIASLLPDIDVKQSKPMRGALMLFGAGIGYLAVRTLPFQFTTLEFGVLWLLIWLVANQILQVLFIRFVVHRGIWHSLLMAVVLAVSSAITADTFFAQSTQMSWLVAGFILLGYLTHLTLDELASVDVRGNRVKRSFGTALKPISLRNWPASLFLIGWLYFLLGFAPHPAPVLAGLNTLGIPTTWVAQHWPRWSFNYWQTWGRVLGLSR